MNSTRFIGPVSPTLRQLREAMNAAFKVWASSEILRLQKLIIGHETKLERLRPRLIAEAERTQLDEKFHVLFDVDQQWTKNLANATERYTALNILKDAARVQIDDILNRHARAWERFGEAPENAELYAAYTKECARRQIRRDERESLTAALKREGLL